MSQDVPIGRSQVSLAQLNDRSREIFRQIVESYLTTGEPLGSRNLSRLIQTPLSPASVRNVMADLEQLGLIFAPHTSAGRVPTALGYRLFVDTMLTAQQGEMDAPALTPDQPQKVIASAAQLLSNLSHFVGVVMAPRRSSVFKHIEFLRLSERRVLVIIVSPDGDVQNRVLCEKYWRGDQPCNEMESVRIQHRLLRQLVDYVDAQNGGPGKGFLRIVSSAADARRVIADGKVAVTLGIEISEPFGCREVSGRSLCSRTDIDRGLDELKSMGIRQVILTHKFDNALGGTRFDQGVTGAAVNTGEQ